MAVSKIEQFDPSQETFPRYVKRVKNYFEANDIGAGKKRAVFLNALGRKHYSLVANLVSPDDPEDKTFAQLVEILTKHFQPTTSVIAERYSFHCRHQDPAESIADFVVALKKLIITCQYQPAVQGVLLRDRFVCGLAHEATRKRLLTEDDTLTFQRAVEIASSVEKASVQARQMKVTMADGRLPVHQVKGKQQNHTRGQSSGMNKHTSTSNKPCYRCGGPHAASTCRFSNETCRACGKTGHIARVCRSKPQSSRQPPVGTAPNSGNRTHFLETTAPSQTPERADVYTMYSMVSRPAKPIILTIKINNQPLEMELDTGASVSVISESTYMTFLNSIPLETTDISLRTYLGEELQVIGVITVTVCYEEQSADLPLVVVAGEGTSLFGRNWLEHIKLNWTDISQVTRDQGIEQLLEQHKSLFREGLGTITGLEAQIHVDPNTKPRYFKPRPVPYTLRHKVEVELIRLQEEGVIKPVRFSEWATPIVPVVKEDGSVRICGDYKVTVNAVSKVDQYPLPRVEDLFTAMSGGKYFSKLDLKHAYQQVLLAEESQKYTTITTLNGLFQYRRLPFGISSAPAIFQRAMESLLQDIPGTVVYIDDVLVTGVNQEDHLRNLDAVMTRLEGAGITLKRTKCVFRAKSVEYLGHIIDRDGLHPTPEKVRAIRDAPTPKNLTELKSFLGLINYYSKFIPDIATTLSPLYRLLSKEVPWKWTYEEQSAFQLAKQQLQSNDVLVHYDTNKDLILACDASPYGVGAVLAHKMEDQSERPIAFASRTLASAEKGYAQIEKEGLAIIFGIKKFHQYLYGRSFTIYSDHQPLKHLFSESRQVPVMASSRIRRWALMLGGYEFNIQYRPGKKMANADALSRLPLSNSPQNSEIPELGDVKAVFQALSEEVLTTEHIRKWTKADPVMARVYHFILNGWSASSPDTSFKPYFNRQGELSVSDGCILWGARVVVPPQGRPAVLSLLHESHPGICRMKGLARAYVWWPGIDDDIASTVERCHDCQLNRHPAPKAPLHPWEWPSQPWSRIHIDHAGPFLEKTFLVVIDAHSKWMEVHIVPSTSAEATIAKLRDMFARFGLPQQLVSDNGSGFTSKEFQQFLSANGIRQVLTAPYHPSSNGLAERAVQTFKNAMVKLEGPLETRLSKFLFQYRITPQSTTGVSPAQLLMGRRLRTHLDLLHPDTSSRVQARLEKSQSGKPPRVFDIGDRVYAKNYGNGPQWISGKIVKVTGPLSYHIETDDGREWRRHVDQVRKRQTSRPAHPNYPTPEVQEDDWVEPDGFTGIRTPTSPTRQSTSTAPRHPSPLAPPINRYPSRIRLPVNRYSPSRNS